MQVTIKRDFDLKEVNEVMDVLAEMLHEERKHKGSLVRGHGWALATAMHILDQVTQGLGDPPTVPSYRELLNQMIDDLRDVPEEPTLADRPAGMLNQMIDNVWNEPDDDIVERHRRARLQRRQRYARRQHHML
jgi:hypothetical protein